MAYIHRVYDESNFKSKCNTNLIYYNMYKLHDSIPPSNGNNFLNRASLTCNFERIDLRVYQAG